MQIIVYLNNLHAKLLFHWFPCTRCIFCTTKTPNCAKLIN